MKLNLITIHGVRGYIDESGTAQLNLEDVSRGLGFTRIATSGNEVIRWERVRGYLEEMGVPIRGHELTGKDGLPDYVQESYFYLLSMKASNDAAIAFQRTVAFDILPSIRKTGSFNVQQQLPQTFGEALRRLADKVEENEILQTQNLMLEQRVKEYEPKISYIDTILKSKGTVTITQIAKDYGMSGPQLNKILHEECVQYKQNKQWLLYRKHQDEGYTKSETIDITRSNGDPDVTMNTRWTQKGRLFIHEILSKRSIVPFMDRKEAA
jgi:phage antirepressor YoqD-like protein